VLETIFESEAEMIAFFQRLAGYFLTGNVAERVLPICWGEGANGKTTIFNTLMATLGPDYAMPAMRDLLLVKRVDTHPTDQAALFGKRLVVSMESGQGRRVDEDLVKHLTGTDRITARRMREDPWSFDPTHTLVLATNHMPDIRGTDDAIWD